MPGMWKPRAMAGKADFTRKGFDSRESLYHKFALLGSRKRKKKDGLSSEISQIEEKPNYFLQEFGWGGGGDT